MKRKWMLTLTAAALGMTLMLAGCGGNGTDTSSDNSSHNGNVSDTSRTDDMGDRSSTPDSTGGLGDDVSDMIGDINSGIDRMR